MSTDVLVGRWLAFCLHPVAAWPRLDTRGRVLMAATYCAASFTAVLLALLVA